MQISGYASLAAVVRTVRIQINTISSTSVPEGSLI
jgi:hypothetical protein